LELLEAILTVHKATEAERTALAHGHFGISDNVLLTPAGFGKLIVEDAEKWGKVIKFAGIKAD